MSEIQREYKPKGLVVVAGTIDPGGMPALEQFVAQFNPQFAIGAMDNQLVYSFGQYGMQTRTFVPMLFFIDKSGVVRAQHMGNDPLFLDDQLLHLREAVNSTFYPAPAAKKKK